MNDITIRKATHIDLPMLREFEQGLIEAERPFDPTIRDNPLRYYDLEAILESESSIIVVAQYQEEIIGCGMVLTADARPYLKHKTYANIRFLYTVPEYRGKGVNALVIDFLKQWAHTKNLFEIRLTVYQDNLPAIKAYEKVGFHKHIIEMRLP